jgi:hypothetical protein
MGPKAVLDAAVKRKIPSPRRESNPRKPIVQPVAIFSGLFSNGYYFVIDINIFSRDSSVV